MKTKIIVACIGVLLLVGCTAPTQHIATQALQRGIDQSHTVFYDMSRIARQEILNAGAAAAVEAVTNQDTDAAQAAIKSVFDKMNDVDWLHIQWERSRALMRIGQEFIWGQEGILDILKKEWETASDRVEDS